MVSLRTFHLVFVLAAMILADMFGAWAIWHDAEAHDPLTLALGYVALAASLGLAAYALQVVRTFDRAHIA